MILPGEPWLLDLFCGAGGCSEGYSRAGFHVHGVDHVEQRNYRFGFFKADALDFLRNLPPSHKFDVIHASPPCQRFSKARHTPGSRGREYPDLLSETLHLLQNQDRPWVVENVPGAPLPCPITLCGTMFGLPVRRHRLFSSSVFLMMPAVDCNHQDGDLTIFGHCVQVCGSRGAAYVAGSGRTHYRPLRVDTDQGRLAMDCNWMNRAELSQAIPPVFTEFIGRQLLRAIG
jgi:DNA (cytosine-5)-methyltransferase 1